MQSLDKPEISAADRSVAVFFLLRDLLLWQKTSGHASVLHGLPTQRKGFPQPRWATVIRHKRYENSDSKCRTSPEYWRLSASRKDSFPSAKFTLGGPRTSGRVGKSVGGTTKSGPRVPQWATGGTTQNRRGIPGSIRITGLLRFLFRLEKWDVSEPPSFPGFTANYLMWRKAVLRWKMATDHPVEKLVPRS